MTRHGRRARRAAPPRITHDFGRATALSCRECGQDYPLGDRYVCEECFGPLEVAYAIGSLDPRRDRGRTRARSGAIAPLLPVPADVASAPGLAPGLHPAGPRRQPGPRARAALAVGQGRHAATRRTRSRTAWSPSRSSAARTLGLDTLACASTGNLAERGRRGRRPRRAAVGRRDPVGPRGRQGHHDRRLRRDAGRRRGHLRRRQPAVLRDRRRGVGGQLGVRQHQPPGVLRRGLQDRRLRDRRGPRLAAALADRLAGRVRVAAHQGGQGVPRARRRWGWSRPTPYGSSGRRRPGCSPVVAGLPCRPRRRPAGPARHHRQVAGHREPRRRAVRAGRRAGAPAVPSRTSPTPRSSRASGCSPRPRGSSPRRPAA